MKVNEIFYSLQGEGCRQGQPSIFIRLAGCDLTCGFCDTEFESGKEMTLFEIREYIKQWPCKYIVWTGGEPALQLTSEIILTMKSFGYKQSIETNGNNKVPIELDLISLSPKVAEHVIANNFKMFTHKYFNENVEVILPKIEVRYVRHKGQMSLPVPVVKADHYFISPMFDGSNINLENLNHCVKLIQENESDINWTLSLQMHKIIKVL